MKRILAGLMAVFSLTGAALAPAWAAPVDTGHIQAELVAASQGITPGGTVQVALRQAIDKGWHTYWRNPGDSGEATRLALVLPAGWTASPFTWPTPERLPVGPLVNYGYEGEVLLPMTLTVPADAQVGNTVTLRGKADFLVCEEICIPETAELALELPVVARAAPADPKWGPAIDRALSAAPKPAALIAAYQPAAAGLTLAIAGAPLHGTDGAGAYFFPSAPGMLDHAAVQVIERGPEGLTLTLVPGADFQAAKTPAVLDGVLSIGGQAYEISAASGPAPPGARGLGPPLAAPPVGGLGLPLAVAFALLGGLVLNLMPCVFPILAMKAAALAGHGHETRAARVQGLAFAAGVLSAFLMLAGALIALKAAGAAVGWGFQLQSPPVVAGLALLMLAVAMNLSGVFEVGSSLQGAGDSLAARGGAAGAFFTGALAVVVATPCTAPFMAPALGWALVQPPAASLAVFLALGVGFAAPFVALAFAPGLLARLPKPGPWMDAFRKALAFPMYAAAAWLVWVLSQQAGPDGLARVLAAAVILAAAAWLYGAAQRKVLSGGSPAASGVAAVLFAVLAIAAAVGPGYSAPQAVGTASSAKIPFEPYSAQRLAALRAEGRPVFVNFTAAWCVSCQVNERVALSGAKVAEALENNGVAYLKADWTRKDAVIAAELARHGRAGVPLYLVYRPGSAEPQILPSILTEGAVVRALAATRS
jgi:thiol:disulfide interchange protein